MFRFSVNTAITKVDRFEYHFSQHYFDSAILYIQMRKDSMVSRQKEEDKTYFCAVCNEIAQMMCGKCQSTYYCKPDHQRMHWKVHNKNCKSAAQRRRDQLDYKRIRKTQIFDYLARQEINKAIKITNDMIDQEHKFLQKELKETEDIQMEIELGSTVCVQIRLLIASKQFSTAQDILSDYFKEKNYFLSNIDTVKSKEELDVMDEKERKRWMYLISGKLKLISSLANLMHELIRNSVDMFSILIAHFEKVYGMDSLELSNVYFYTANYLNFLNQSTKALACFLKAAKMRKEKGGTAYYNAALLLLKADRKKKALQFFHKALQLIEGEKNHQNNYVIAEIHENIALIYMQTGQSKAMIDYFEKAYFYYIRNNCKAKAQNIMKLFILIRKQAKEEGGDDMKTIEFSKERKDKRPVEVLSSKNKEKYRNADKVAEDDERKVGEWLAGFKQLKLNYNQPSAIKPPKQLEYLFGNQVKNGEEEDASSSMNENNRYTISEGLNMDLNYMRSLTSSQVGYLHELNRLLMESKEPAAYYDIVQNSNFYQNVCGDRQKLNNFYRLNNKLVRPTDLERKLLMQITQEDFQNEEQFEHEYNVPPKKAPVTPRLDLTKLKQFQNQ